MARPKGLKSAQRGKPGKMRSYMDDGSAGPFNPMPVSQKQRPNFAKRIIGASDKVTMQNMEESVTDYMNRIVRNSKAVNGKGFKQPKRGGRNG